MKTKYAIYCVLIALAAFSAPVSAEHNIISDVNADGIITTADSLLALQMAAGSVAPDPERADVNADGRVNSLDALMIRMMAEKMQVCVNAPEVVSGAFNVTIDIHNVADLDSGQFDLSFNSSVVNVTAVHAGNIDGKQVPVDSWQFMDAGTIRMLFNLPGVRGVSGSGYVARIDFEVTGSHGDISVLDISDVGLVDTGADEIPAVWIDDEVTIGEHTPVNQVRNINTGEIFSSIKDAINDYDTSDGDVLEVGDGVYRENVQVTKSLTIRSENGPSNCIIQAARRYKHVVEVTTNYVRVSGFTVMGLPESAFSSAGIHLTASYCNVSNNNCSNNEYGIRLYGSGNNIISNNTCSNNERSGISLGYSSNNIISGNTCSTNEYGILLDDSSDNRLTSNSMFENGISISGNSLSDYTHEIDESNTVNGKPVYYWLDIESGRIPGGAGQVILVNCNDILVEDQELNNANVGVEAVFSSNVTIRNNTCSNNDVGIYLGHSSNNSISNNICSNNERAGIYIYDSSNNSISDNTCSNNDVGIYLRYSSNNRLTGNSMFGNGISIRGNSLSYYTHEIDESNMVNGKPVYYWLDIESGRIPGGAGQVILVNCKDVLVEDQELNNANVGVEAVFSSNVTIRNNTCSNNDVGIYLGDSSNTSISDNTCSNNEWAGIHIDDSSNNSISDNTCSNNYWAGVRLDDSSNNSISDNTCSNNERAGICLDDSSNSKLTGNSMFGNGISIRGNSLSYYTHEIDESNMVNGKPVYYWLDTKSGRIPEGAGQVILVNCKDVLVEDQELHNASIGIKVAFSSNIAIRTNNCSNNRDAGIHLYESRETAIYLNSFMNNAGDIKTSSCPSANIWNSTLKIDYTYNDTTFSNYLGNYWDDYTGRDSDGDGVGDTPYDIGSGKDNHPLMVPFENCSAVSVDAPGIVSGAFNATINVRHIGDLDSGQFDLTFDSNIMNVTGVDAGTIENTTVQVNWRFMDADTIRVLFELSDELGVSGSGYVARMDFAMLGPLGCVSVLDISNGKLVDTGGSEIPALWIDKEVIIAVPVTVNAPLIVTDTFEVTIDVENVTDLDSGQFEFSFDPSVVTVEDVRAGSVGNTEIPTMWSFRNADTIIVIFNLPGIRGVSGSGCAARINFELTGSPGDASVLDISNGLLVNNNADKIPAIWNDCEVTIGEDTPVNQVRNVNTGEDFSFIQAAIDDPDTSDGHIIEVEDGVYHENANVTKSLTIRSENGSANCVIQAARRCEHVVTVTVDCVNISGFKVLGATSDKAGIYLSAGYCNVSNNNCSNNCVGIRLSESCKNIVSGNNCSNTNYESIRLDGSDNNIVSSNDCSNNNYDGIRLYESCNNIVSCNNCSNNQDDGVYFYKSCNNVIYLNNFINNKDNINSRSSANIWNSTSRINYTYKDRTFTNYLGNYWDDYEGSDSDNDGIGDSPYRISSDRDNCPLMVPFENYSVPTENMMHVSVNAPEVISGSFNATIDIHHVADLGSGQFDLSFDSRIVNVTDVDAGNIGGTTVPIVNWRFTDADTIRVTFKLSGEGGVGGSGYMARIGFAMLGLRGCVSVLDISNGKLVDAGGEEIPAVWFDDKVIIPAPVTVNAPPVATDTFEVTIDVENVTDMDCGQFELSFDPGVVIVEDVEVGCISDTEIPVIGWWFMDVNRIGVLFNLPGIKGVSGSGYVAKITFELTGSEGDSCVLDISEGLLVNNNAEKMPVIWTDSEVTIGECTPVNRVRNINTGEEFPFIRIAIDDPDTLEGHVIEVEDGVYHENLRVAKSLTIRSENGSANCIIQDVGSDHVVEITADHANVSGFTVTRRAGRSASDSAGIYLNACYCNVSCNNCSNKGIGIFIDGSYNNISNNKCSHNGDGIWLDSSDNNIISNNNCSNNWDDGIWLDGSSNNRLTGNVMFESGIFIQGDSLSDYTHEIDESNTVNGKPVYYWKDIESGRIPEGAGQVILVNCNGILVESQELNDASVGVEIAFSTNITIRNNTCSNNQYGAYFAHSSNNSISNNKCSHNHDTGIWLDSSGNNSISSNDCSKNRESICFEYSYSNVIYLNNLDNINSRSSANIWNSTSKINYTYRDMAFANYLGNYWDDYMGSDSEKDGIGDSPYRIGSDRDNYPLMMPFENYFTPEESRAQVSVNAPEIVSGAFDATIDISNVVDLDYGQFDLTFDPGVVNVTAVVGKQMPIVSWEFIDSDTITVLFNPQGTAGLRGSGRIATISFEVTGSQGDMSVLDLSDGTLTDTVADEIPAIWNDSEVTVGVPVTVSAPDIVSIVSGAFNATIEIEDVACMNGGHFDLTFELDVVNVTDVTAGNIDGTTIPIVNWRFMDANTIRVLFELSGDDAVSGSGCVARMAFEITGSQGDSCVLDISEGKLADTEGDAIPAIWIDDEMVIGVPVTVNAPELVSDTFNATIDMRNVTNLYAGQFDLSFDPSVVNVRGVDAGNISGTTIPIIGWRFMGADRIRVIFMLSGPDDIVSGSGYVTRIDFETTGSEGGACVLDISNGALVGITFNEWGGAMPEEIPAIWIDDEVAIGEPTPPPPTQTSVHNINTGENFPAI